MALNGFGDAALVDQLKGELKALGAGIERQSN